MYETDTYESLFAETVAFPGHNGDVVNAYFARPTGAGPMPGLVLVHHMPGWDEWYKEATLRMARHGYATISPNLYARTGHGSPEDVAARVRAAGGVPDAQVVGDMAGAMRYLRALPYASGKVGVMGSCSGGRHAYLAACCAPGFDAIVDLWGGGVVMRQEDLTPNRPVSPIDYTKDLPCPILGIFGLEDRAPTPDQVDLHEAELKRLGKSYEFHRYPESGHGFFYHDRPAYRQAQAADGWQKVFDFLGRTLGPS